MKHHKERRRDQFAINGPRKRFLYEITRVLENARVTLVTFRRSKGRGEQQLRAAYAAVLE